MWRPLTREGVPEKRREGRPPHEARFRQDASDTSVLHSSLTLLMEWRRQQPPVVEAQLHLLHVDDLLQPPVAPQRAALAAGWRGDGAAVGWMLVSGKRSELIQRLERVVQIEGRALRHEEEDRRLDAQDSRQQAQDNRRRRVRRLPSHLRD